MAGEMVKKQGRARFYLSVSGKNPPGKKPPVTGQG